MLDGGAQWSPKRFFRIARLARVILFTAKMPNPHTNAKVLRFISKYRNNKYYTKSKLGCWFAFDKKDSNTYANHGDDLEEPEAEHNFQTSEYYGIIHWQSKEICNGVFFRAMCNSSFSLSLVNKKCWILVAVLTVSQILVVVSVCWWITTEF